MKIFQTNTPALQYEFEFDFNYCCALRRAELFVLFLLFVLRKARTADSL